MNIYISLKYKRIYFLVNGQLRYVATNEVYNRSIKKELEARHPKWINLTPSRDMEILPRGKYMRDGLMGLALIALLYFIVVLAFVL